MKLRKSINTLFLLVVLFLLFGCNSTNEDYKQKAKDEYLSDKGVDLEGLGTKESPYMVYNPRDFNQIKQNPKGYYKLANNIDFNSEHFKEENGLYYFGYEPVLVFTGGLDGDGYTLKYEGDIVKPLFMNLEKALISNLVIDWNIENHKTTMEIYSSISNSYDYGIITNHNLDSVINNIELNVSLKINITERKVNPFERNISAVAGINRGQISNINGNVDVYFRGQNSSAYESKVNYGSISGNNYGIINNINIINNLDIDTSKEVHELRVGGISGYNNGMISICRASSIITAKSTKNDPMADGSVSSGGVVGINSGFGVIKDIYTYNNNIDSYSMSFTYSAGIAGENNGVVSNTYSSGLYKSSGYWSSFISDPKTGLIVAAGSADEVLNNVTYSDTKTNIYGFNGRLDTNILLSSTSELESFIVTNKNNGYFNSINWDNDHFRLVLDEDYWSYDYNSDNYTFLLVGGLYE